MKRILSFLLFAAFLMPWSAQAQSSAFLSEDFEGGAMPAGWTTDGSGTWSVATGDYSASTGAGEGSYNAKITHGTTGATTKLITPAMDLSSAAAAELSFMHIQRSWSGDYDELRVYYRTSSEDEWVLIPGQEYTSSVASWTQVEGVALPNLSASYQIAFEMTDNYGYGVGLDMVTVAAPPTCIKPATLEASAITAAGATLIWTAGNNESSFQYVAMPAGTAVDWTNAVTVSDALTADVTGLTAETNYDIYLRAYCSESDQSDARMISITTLPTCVAPDSLNATPASTSSATITWVAGNGETAFDYVYALAGEEPDWTSPVAVNALTATITGLNQDADYVFYVRANCGEEDLSAVRNISFHAMRYCTPAPTSVDGSGITAVALGGVEQTEAVHKTSATKPFYADNHTLSFEVAASTVATVDITFATGYTYGTVIWVDWNNNMEFEADELVYAGTSASTNPTTLNCTFTVPATQAEGTYRMRIGAADTYFDSYVGGGAYNADYPCSNGTYRLYEDYSITVTAAPSCTQPATFTYENVTAYGATLNWTAGLSETQFQYVAMPKDTAVDWTGATLVTGLTATISTLAPETAYDIYLRAYCGETEQSDASMLSFTTIPSCVQPTLPVVSDETVSGATLTWKAGNGETQFQYVVMPKDSAVDWTAASLVADTTVTVTGLTANTAYDFYVRAYCATDDQSAVRKVSFRTACGVSSLPFEENFNKLTTGIPSCWDNTEGTTTSASYKWSYYATGFDGACVRFNSYNNSNGKTNILVSPAINLTADAQLTFMWKNPTGGAGEVLISTDGGENMTSLLNELTGVSAWTEKTIDLSAYTGQTVNIYFKGTSNYGNGDAYLYLDNVKVAEIPACFKPTNVAASNIAVNSAALTCTAGGNETLWFVRYKTAEAEEWTMVENAVDTPYVLTGLNANTVYEVQMAAVCGTEPGEWSNTLSFRTLCDAEELPYADGFENGIYCWKVGNKQSTSSSYIPSAYSSATYAHAGSYSLRMNAYKYSSTNADSAYAILPAMNFGENGVSAYTLKFYARKGGTTSSSSNYYDQLLVGVVTDPSDIRTFTLVQSVTVTGTTHQLYEIPFTAYAGEGQYMAILAVYDPQTTATYRYGQFYVDDIAVERTPACQPLASITTVPARTKVEVTLNPKPGMDLAAAYELVYADSALTAEQLEAADKTVVTDSVYTITGLERETPYYIYVRANCGQEDGVSAWVSTQVTTKGLAACDEILEVGDGTTTTYGPICAFYGYERNGYIFTPADGLTAGNIGSIAWNYSSAATMPAKVYLKNTEDTAFVTTLVWNELISGATLVYDNTIALATGWNTIEFTTPFAYTGDNLMILVESNKGGSGGGSASAYYTTGTNDAAHFYIRKDSSIDDTQAYSTFSTKAMNNQRHNIRFGMCYNLDPCPAVTDMAVALVGDGTSEARISWTTADADYLSSYDLLLSTTEITDFSEVTPTVTNIAPTAVSYDLTNLTAETHYYVYLRANCQTQGHDEGMSDWVGVDTVMNADCAAPNTLTTEFIGLNAVKAMWNLAFEGQTMAFRYILSDVELDAAGIAAATPVDADSNVIEISELAYGQVYYLYVASACGAATSDYISTSFTTYAACAPVTNLTAARVEHNRVLLTWTKNPFGTETAYEVGIVGQESNALIVDTTTAMIIGLEADSAYTAYVKAICGEESASAVETVSFTTASMPGNCATVGTGTNSANLIYSSYGNTYSQQIYTAAELNEMGYAAGTITSISFYYSGTSSTYEKTQSIYMGMVESSSFAGYTANDFIGGLTLVYEPTLLSYQAGWREYELTTPFVWDGTSNIVIGVLTNSTQTSSSGWTTRGTTTSPEYRSIYRYRDTTPIDIEDLASVNYGSRSYNRPNIQICFTPKACPDVTALTISNITTTTAVATWEPIGMETAWKVYLSNVNIVNTATIVGTEVGSMTYAMAELLPDQDYWFYVQPVCTGADGWRVATFRTVATCFPPTALTTDTVEARTATVSWTDANEVGNYTVAYGIAADFDLSDATTYDVVNVTTLNAVLTNLVPETTYAFAVKANCGVNDESRYSSAANFTTAISCFAPTNLVASNARANSVVISWTDTHDAAAYTVYYGDAATFSIDDEIYMTADAETKEIVLTGLEANSSYKVAVKSVCGPNDESAISSVLTFSTASLLPYAPVFGTALPTEMIMRGGLMNADTVYTSTLGTSSTPNWTFKGSDAAIDGAHMKLNIYGTSCKAWITTPVFDMSMLTEEDNVVLDFDIALCKWNNPGTAPTSTDNDDKFAVIISEDGGASWMKSNMILWQDNAEDADFSFAGIPTTAQHITINMAPYAGKSVCVAFYGESTVSGADNDLHVGNIRLMKVVNYTEETCQNEMIDNHGFEAANTDSAGVFHFEEMRAAEFGLVTFDLTVYESLSNEVIIETAYVGDHYVDRFYDFIVQEGDEEAYGFEEMSSHGCDSTWLITFYNILTAETILEDSVLAEGETIIWHGQTIEEAGLYYDTVRSEMGGVMAYYELTVTEALPPVQGKTFELVTAQLADWTGNYLIVFADNMAHATVSGKDLAATSDVLTISEDNKIVTADSCFVTVAAMGTDYSVQLPNGNYLGAQKNGVTSNANAVALTINYTADGVQIAGMASGTEYILYRNTNNGTFYRMYVDKTGVSGYTLPQLYKEVGGEGPATKVDTIQAEDNAVKVILNGNLYIIRDNQWYDATGRMTEDPRK